MGSNPTPGTNAIRMINMDVYDIIAKEYRKIFAISLPYKDGPNAEYRTIIKNLEDGSITISPLKWLEKVDTDVDEGYLETKVIGRKSKIKIESYPTFDIIEYSNKRYLGKVITKPWSLRPFFMFLDKNSSNIKVIDMENDSIREINIDSDSILTFDTPLCGGIFEDRVIVNLGTQSTLYSITDYEEFGPVVSIPHTITEVYKTTARGLAFSSVGTVSLESSSYFVNCQGKVVKIINSPIDIRDAMLDDDWIAIVLQIEHLSPLKVIEEHNNSRIMFLKVDSEVLDATFISSRKYAFVDGMAWLLDINKKYVAVESNMEIIFYDRRGREMLTLDETEVSCDIIGECAFHPTDPEKFVFIDNMGKPRVLNLLI